MYRLVLYQVRKTALTVGNGAGRGGERSNNLEESAAKHATGGSSDMVPTTVVTEAWEEPKSLRPVAGNWDGDQHSVFRGGGIPHVPLP